jgi:hypothetical protein
MERSAVKRTGQIIQTQSIDLAWHSIPGLDRINKDDSLIPRHQVQQTKTSSSGFGHFDLRTGHLILQSFSNPDTNTIIPTYWVPQA